MYLERALFPALPTDLSGALTAHRGAGSNIRVLQVETRLILHPPPSFTEEEAQGPGKQLPLSVDAGIPTRKTGEFLKKGPLQPDPHTLLFPGPLSPNVVLLQVHNTPQSPLLLSVSPTRGRLWVLESLQMLPHSLYSC